MDKKNQRAVFYPLQTFTKGVQVDFSAIPLCLEAREKTDFTMLQNMTTAIGSPSYKISSEQRRALHVSAVFVNNFRCQIFCCM